ncbi:MAG: peptide-N-glycosidase F-related protein, partial [Candidatus Neomarinimicrobiota bacterium]
VGTIPFNPDFDNNTPPIVFEVPEDATKVEFVSYITGHGWGCDGFNCAEFCNSKHMFTVNGGVHEFETVIPRQLDDQYTLHGTLDTIVRRS